MNKKKSEFHKDSNRVDGCSHYCKQCVLAKYYHNKPKVFIQKEIQHYTHDYKRVIKNLQLSPPIEDYSNSLTVGDWDNLTDKQKQNYENRN
jgi:hypothetical protein